MLSMIDSGEEYEAHPGILGAVVLVGKGVKIRPV
jgi:hypothetical protein